jgi:hypothetical protein
MAPLVSKESLTGDSLQTVLYFSLSPPSISLLGDYVPLLTVCRHAYRLFNQVV